MKSMIIVALSMCLFLMSCNSPYSDGEKAAEAFNKSEQTYLTDLQNKVGEYINKFDSYGFSTRVEARQKLNSIITEVRTNYESDLRSAERLYAQLKNRYGNKYEEAQSFAEGFEGRRKYENIDTTAILPMQAEINSLIKTIIPPKPNLEKIQKDLVGRYWQDKEDGYFGTNKRIIKDGTVKDVRIISESNQPNIYLVNAILSIQERSGSAIYKIDSDIKYILGDFDDWSIDYLGSNSVDIERTGQFDKYIKSKIIAPWLKNELELSNLSDATLVVGGIVLEKSRSQWRKFYVELAPNSTKVIGGLFSTPYYDDIIEYEIHFVERK